MPSTTCGLLSAGRTTNDNVRAISSSFFPRRSRPGPNIDGVARRAAAARPLVRVVRAESAPNGDSHSVRTSAVVGATSSRPSSETTTTSTTTTPTTASLAPLMAEASIEVVASNALVFTRPQKEEKETVHADDDVAPSGTAVRAVWERIERRNLHEPEYLQAVAEVLETMRPVFARSLEYLPVFERMAEPERMLMFRVPWVDDEGSTHVNRGFRVQFNSALGPYKGGLRFHPSVNLSVVKFLGFEQILKNSLTTLPMGGGKGGADFDPKGKSDGEVMRFCQSFMTELSRHIGPDTDVPAGDIGVGGREIGYLFGQYKRLRNEFTGTLTGKGPQWGGSNMRPQATGYGAVYFAREMLDDIGSSLEGKRVALSGSGNVAQFAVEKLIELGAIPVTMSDSSGTIYEPEGITSKHLSAIMDLKNKRRGRLSEYPSLSSTGKYHAGKNPWHLPWVDIAMPCATQNELNEGDAHALVESGCLLVVEGANMPSTPSAIEVFHEHSILFAPAKAANAGGVAVSGLEMSQNSQRMKWTREEVDEKLQAIMKDIYRSCKKSATDYNVTIQAGANISGFVTVADSMIAQGCV